MTNLDKPNWLTEYFTRQDIVAEQNIEASDLVRMWSVTADGQVDSWNVKKLIEATHESVINRAMSMGIDECCEEIERLWRDTLQYKNLVLRLVDYSVTHRSELRAIAHQFVHDIPHVDEDDLINDAVVATLIAMREKRESCSPVNITYIKGWLVRIIKNKGINLREKTFGSKGSERQEEPLLQEQPRPKKRRNILPLPFVSLEGEAEKNDHITNQSMPEMEQPDKLVMDAENYRELEQLLASVPPDVIEVMRLYMHMYGKKEIAEELKKSVNTVNTDIQRWVPKLRKKYYQQYPERKDELERRIRALPTIEEEKTMVQLHLVECRTYAEIGERCVPPEAGSVVKAIVTRWSRKLYYNLLIEE